MNRQAHSATIIQGRPRLKALCTAALIFILASCATGTAEEDGWLEKGSRLSGSEAAAFYTEAIAEEPSYQLWYNLAYSYLEAGDYEKAAETAAEAEALYPDMIRFDYLELYAYRESGRMYSYEKKLESLHERFPANDDVSEMLLDAYYGAKREKAEEVARSLLRRDPSNRTAIRALGEFHPFYQAISDHEAEIADEEWDKGPVRLYNILDTLEDRLISSP